MVPWPVWVALVCGVVACTRPVETATPGADAGVIRGTTGGGGAVEGSSGCGDDGAQPAKVLFHVPRAGETSADFYRLPFPNDIRLKNGHVDLSGHPRPGATVLPYDVVDRYLRAIEAEATGFSVNPAVYFRFSRNPSLNSLARDDAVAFTNITAGSPQYGRLAQPGWYASTAGGRYICPRWMVLRHGFGAPLRAGETYAYLVRRTVTDESGTPMGQDDDFRALLAPSAPSDPDLAAAWRAYAPLRAWIADQKIDASTLAAAAVFTTERVEEPLARMRAVVRSAPAPAIKDLVRCGGAQPSPCDDGLTGDDHQRGCGPPSTAYDEYQGTVSIPVFQKGTPPYEQPADGGGVELGADGTPQVQRSEDVCFALTVPRGAPPAAGWPVVVYSHGTGGSYRSAIDLGLAAELALGAGDAGAATPLATFAYDGVLHGPRQGHSTRPVTELVYNLANPQAARDNAVQAAADLFAVARALEAFPAAGVTLDAGRVALYGHSQGGNAAANAVAFEPVYGAAVLSGTGGTLVLGLLHKAQPVNIAALIPLVLGEPTVDEHHPVLNLLQMYLDRADSVNYGRRIFVDPRPGMRPRHVLQIFGTDDTFAPVETQRTFARAAGLDIVGPVLDAQDREDIAEDRRPPAIPGPAHGNLRGPDGTPVTAVQAQYRPVGYDGHFVSTENASARRAVHQMLATFARDGVPTVTP